MTPTELRKVAADICRNDPIYYVETFVHIEDKDADELIQPFTLWDGQKEALLGFVSNRLNVVLKARQLGLTWLALAEGSRLLVLNTGRTVVGLSRSEEEAKELVRRLAVILRYMPEFVREANDVVPGWSGPVFSSSALTLTVAFPDGPESVFKAFPSSPAAARSFTADLIIIDEWAFQQYADEIWTSAFPVINRPFGGRVIGLSTIKRGTMFEEIFTNPDNGFNKIFLPWQTDPRRDGEWYSKTLAALGEDMTMQEYPSTIEEALTVPGGAFFPEVKKETHIRSDEPKGPVRRYTCIDYGLDMFSIHWVEIDEEGRARVYREFEEPNLTISEASEIALKLTGDEKIEANLAPPDLWNRSQESGRSRAQLFDDAGLSLLKTSNDLEAGCAAMKEWLMVRDDEPLMTFQEGKCPKLYKNLQKIQKDELRPNIYAKQPHNLTHSVDSLRCFCVYWTSPADSVKTHKKAHWEDDLYDDYWRADDATKRRIIETYGDPF